MIAFTLRFLNFCGVKLTSERKCGQCKYLMFQRNVSLVWSVHLKVAPELNLLAENRFLSHFLIVS